MTRHVSLAYTDWYQFGIGEHSAAGHLHDVQFTSHWTPQEWSAS